MQPNKQNKTDLALIRDLPLEDFIPSKVLLSTTSRIKKESTLDDNLSDDDIRTSMVYIQDLIVRRVTGSCLMNQLKLLIHHCQIEYPMYQWYKRLLDDYLFPILVYGVKSDLSLESTLRIRNQGVVRGNDGEHLQYPSLADVKLLEQRQNYKMDLYIDQAIEFLRCNSCHFCELCGWGCPCDCGTAPFHRDYHIPFSIAPYPCKWDPYK